MSIRGRNGTSLSTIHLRRRRFAPSPLAHAMALALAAGGAATAVPAHAQRAFSSGWMAQKTQSQGTATATGRMPNGRPVPVISQQAQQRASQQAQRAVANMGLAARLLAAQRAAQDAARQAALDSAADVPDGLADGGLKVDADSLTAGWLNAKDPVQQTAGGQTRVVIEQTGEKAILNWQTFNVGRNTTVDFLQQPTWSVLNRVNDPAARPSRIAGRIRGDGTVLVVNRNGVIFNGSSQVNTRNLTASTLNIPDDKFRSSYVTTTGDQDGPTFQADLGFTAGDVTVEPGALLQTPPAGRVMLLGGNVSNDGVIVTPDGQALLGAGQQAYLIASTDNDLRGLRIELGAGGGTASNQGLVEAERGNITLAGRDVTVGAGGVLRATTTVTANGSITLQARDAASRYDDPSSFTFLGYRGTHTGTVSIGDGALLQVMPDLDDTQTVTATELLAPSAISLYGSTIRVGGGAELLAPGGDLDVQAIAAPLATGTLPDDSQIYVESGAILDVSGTRGVALPAERNFVEVELRGNELRDAPLLRNSFLYGKKVWVDARDTGTFDDPLLADVEWFEGQPGVWYGSALFDASGYIGMIQRGVGELTSRGGTITLNGRGDVVLRSGSMLDASGGTLDFAGGYGRVTYLTDGGGTRVPVGQARPGVQYTGIVGNFTAGHTRWGVTESWGNPIMTPLLYQPAYTEGQAAGTIDLRGAHVAVDGDLFAMAETGERQAIRGQLPTAGTLKLGTVDAVPDPTLLIVDYQLGQVVVQKEAAPLPVDFGAASHLDDASQSVLSTDMLGASGIGTLRIAANGSIVVAADADLDLGQRGSLQLLSSALTVDGKVRAIDGAIELRSASTFSLFPDGGAAQTVTLGTGAMLDVSGAWTNGFFGDAPLPVAGGSISILTPDVRISDTVTGGIEQPNIPHGTIAIADGVRLDVSGGGRADGRGRLESLGAAGSIVLGAGTLDLAPGADLRGYALATDDRAGRGGSLTVVSRGAQALLDSALLASGGFASYSLDGIDAMTVGAGTQIVLAPQNRLIDDPRVLPTGAALDGLPLALLPAGIRAPASLTLRAGLTTNVPSGPSYALYDMTGSVIVEAGSLIDAGVGGSVTLIGSDLVQIDGTIVAPGGSIAARILGPTTVSTSTSTTGMMPYESQDRAIWLGSTARLLAEGALRPSFNRYGWRTGEVLAGGTVTLDASGVGYVVTEAGSLIDVSGGLAQLDLRDYPAPGFLAPRGQAPATRAQDVWSDAGTVNVMARDGAWLDGGYDAAAAPLAHAGGFYLTVGGGMPTGTNAIYDRSIRIRQDGMPALPSGLLPGDSLGPSTVPPDLSAAMPLVRVPARQAQVSADLLMAGGFGTMSLDARNSIVFQDDVTLQAGESLILNSGNLRSQASLPDAAPQVRLGAPYVRIGDVNRRRLQNNAALAPAPGAGRLDVDAGYLEFGLRSVLHGFATAAFASTGDVLFGAQGSQGNSAYGAVSGLVNTAGDLTLGGRQLYAASGTNFVVSSVGEDGAITILPGDPAAPLPWTVGSSLAIKAPHIVHQGVLRAPLGQITLDAGTTGSVTLAEGSMIDVSAHGATLPFGMVINGEWYLDLGVTEQLTTMPGKKVTLAGGSIEIQPGAGLDLSGGGDIAAVEFVPGTGGSRDMLAVPGVFAVVPGEQPQAAPLSTAGSPAVGVGASVHLAGVPGLPDGMYTLLPPEYASLPGAFRVQAVGGANDMPAGPAAARSDGTYLAVGWLASSLSDARASRSTAFLVTPAAAVRRYSEYEINSGNAVFAEAAQKAAQAVPPLGADGGQLVLNALSALELGGRFNLAAGEGGRGGLVDIASSSIAVVGKGDGPVDGYALTVDGATLSAMGAQSLLLGGTRLSTADGYLLNATASDILVANDEDSALTGPEILLLTKSSVGGEGGIAGTGVLTVESGAVIRAQGAYPGDPARLVIGNELAADPLGTGMGSLLAVSNAPELLVNRYDIHGSGAAMAGTIEVEAGATIEADNAVLFDATAGSAIDAEAIIRGRSLEVASDAISFGDVPEHTSGFVANADSLAALAAAQRLVLRSYGTVDFYDNGSFDLRDPASGLSQVGEFVLDAAALRQRSSGSIALSARHLTLRNTVGTLAGGADPAAAQGGLTLAAGQLDVGDGASAILGFAQADLDAGIVLLSGAGSLTAGGAAAANLNVHAPVIATTTGADQSLSATGALDLQAGDTAPPDGGDGLVGMGGRLSLHGATVRAATLLRLPAGVLEFDAEGDLTIAEGAQIDVSGRDQAFFDQVRTLPAGDISLVSQSGNVLVVQGAVLDLSDPQGGGKLSVTVPEGSFGLQGAARGGSFVLDTGTIPDFGALQGGLNDGGFAASRDLRIRNGDVLVDGVTRTRSFTLSADRGAITVTGTIDASGATGGSISLSAAGDVVLASGSRLSVAGEDFDGAGKGGAIFLSAGAHREEDGQDVSDPDAVLDIQPGSFIDLGVASASAAARQIQLNGPGSTIALPVAASIGFPGGTPGDNTLVADAAGVITYPDGSTARFAAGAPISLPPGASLRLDAAGVVKVAGGSGGPTTVALPLTGSFATSGATAVTAVPVTLDAAGSQIVLAGGAPVILPNGTPGNDIISVDAGTVTITTVNDGSQVTMTAGASSLNLSAGANLTVGTATPDGVVIPIGQASLRNLNGTVVTLVRSGTSAISLGGTLTFDQGLPDGATLSAIGNPSYINIGQPFRTAGNTVVIGGAGASVQMIAQGRIHFPDGTPDGVTLQGGVGYSNVRISIYDASGTLVQTVTNATGGTSATTPFTVPRGGYVSASTAPTLQVVQGDAPIRTVAESLANGTGAQSVQYRGVKAIEALTPGSTVIGDYKGSLTFQGSNPLSFLANGSNIDVTDVTLAKLPAGALVTMTRAGSFNPQGAGGDFRLSLGGGGRYTASDVSLGTLTAGSSLALSEQGALRFESGNDGAIALLMPANAGFSAEGTSLIALGGAQAGTLHLRAPQTADGADLRINPIGGTIVGAASIVAEGYKTYDLTGTDGVITQALKDEVRADAGAFAGATPAIKGRLLASQPGLATVLSVVPGVEIINTNGEAPATIEAALDPGATLGLQANTPIAFPAGMAGAFDPLPTAVIEIKTDAGGTVLYLDNASQTVTMPQGTSVVLPDGAPARSFGFEVAYQTSALIVLPDGQQITFSYNTYLNNGYPQDLPPGTRIIFSNPGSFKLTTAMPTPVRVSLSGGIFRTTQAVQILGLPAGATVASIGAASSMSFDGPAAASLQVPADSQLGASSLALMAPAGAPAILTLQNAGKAAVTVDAGIALTLSDGGRISATAAGRLYAADGSLLSAFAAGDTVEAPAGASVKLDAGGTVTAQSAGLRMLVQAGAAYKISGEDLGRTVTLVNTASTLAMSAGASVTLTSQTTATSFNMSSTVPAVIYRPDGTQRAAMAANVSVSVNTGETVVLSAQGTLKLGSSSRTVDVKVNAGTVAGSGTTVDYSYAVPAVAATPSAVSSDIVLKAVNTGDVTQPDLGWDLSDYRFGPDGVPGVLTLRAAGNVRIEGSLSDGFHYTGTYLYNNFYTGASYFAQGSLIDDLSWSYNLVGGADFGAASALGVRPIFQLDPLKGNVQVNASTDADTTVRTGTGDIAVAAGRDIEFNSFWNAAGTSAHYASLYTAGRPANLQGSRTAAFSTLENGRRALSGGAFWMASNGGDIRLAAQQDITGNGRGTDTPEISVWVKSQGNINANNGLYSAVMSWGVTPNAVVGPASLGVRDAVVALGGGNVSAEAGRDVVSMTLASANSGIRVGASPDDSYLQSVGGGDVSLVSGRDAIGNIVYVASGTGTLRAGRDMTDFDYGNGGKFGTRLVLGDAVIDAIARRDANVGAIYTPTMMYRFSENIPWFSNYTDRSRVSVQSLVGDVGVLTARGGDTAPAGSYNDVALTLLPGNFEAVSYAGDIVLGSLSTVNNGASKIEMMPAHDGDLTLLAADSIDFRAIVGMSDADPIVYQSPFIIGNAITWERTLFGQSLSDSLPYLTSRNRTLSHSADLYRANDANPVRIYAVDGDITGQRFGMSRQNGTWTANTLGMAYLSLPKPAQIRAGNDIVDLAVLAQNLRDDQTTAIQAGRDLVFTKDLNLNSGRPEGGGIWIGGPGRLEVTTGRDLALNRSEGIVALGKQLNPYLPDGTSADITLLVGMGAQGADYAGFASAYVAPGASAPHSYTGDMVDFMRRRSGDDTLSADAAWTQFQALPEEDREIFLRGIYYQELIRTGTNGVETGNYNEGYDAVARLFPDDRAYGGDLSLAYSQIKSFYDGGLDILLPKGSIDGGITVVGPDISEAGRKNADQLGMTMLRGGDVHIMLDGDLIVNQSRIFSMGGDMLIWSSHGDINAGKGAKTALLAPPPRPVFDPVSGTSTLELTGAASGSGIATLITEPGQDPGSMWLFAPGGTIDTGDAGIRVSGNLVIGALQIRGVDNIQVQGTTLGLPPRGADVTALTNASVASAQASIAAQDIVQRERASARQALPSIFTVRVLGFGPAPADPVQPEAPAGPASQAPAGTSRARVGYDTGNPVQVLGHGGQFDQAVLSRLTEEERRSLRRP
ncbi:hypothetical protein GCM10023144_38300 [Pigmentiphaga soli]|uniref:Filamentous haemagglutinin FhaB/tRNA nuclease CdiA-like TPS domain-containing protein n=1 Tax=Pigmentiphaga soli TaxID=1007095 RepID=A0ABP8HID7_9BURK